MTGVTVKDHLPSTLAVTPRRVYLHEHAATRGETVPLLFFLLLIILIAQIGFWNTLGAILGAAAMMVLLVVIIVAIVVVGGLFAAKRLMS
jgi:hypothetical protein